MPLPLIQIVTATRLAPDPFLRDAPISRTIQRFGFDRRITSRVFPENSAPLAVAYNKAITDPNGADILLFVHDDVWIDDIFLTERLLEAIEKFDVVGVAGCKERFPRQTSWHQRAPAGKPSEEAYSGAISHREPLGKVTAYGYAPAPVELLDGVFLAARRASLVASRTFFDPQFDFHFYDLDFCRTARRNGLALGTWPIAITHRSPGDFTSVGWAANRDRYLAKWPD